jgi:ribosomal protein S27AE
MQPTDPPRRAASAEPAPSATPADDVERAHRTCPICGGELAERKCKLYCPRPGCGYFLSCADYY